ncbi:carbohydrate ABC transporter permease [Actinacidiphila yeochonensis]|uniref:carbohydrate ABC transporter permease n=1 Tax=Actinacidiphila yeochonensis TaxID=89050 RepID=UPI00055D5D51|nr:carbohydrate ABC transporter permease [Actinacidiphila yeochonensis]
MSVRAVRSGRRGPVPYVVLLGFVAVAVLMVGPFVLVAMNSVKSRTDFAAHGGMSVPSSVDLDSFRTFWNSVGFTHVLTNSVVVGASVAVLAVVVSLFNAYAIGIGRVKGRLWILGVFLLGNLLPQEALVYPLYDLAKRVGLYDNILAVIIVFTVIQGAFGTYLLSSVLSSFPTEILEAARLDGAGRWRILWRIVVPVSRPTIGVMLTLFFIWTWNEFFIPMVLLPSSANQTVSVSIATTQGQHMVDITMQAASSMLAVIPAVIFFLLFQRTLTRGVAVGAVK